MKWIKKVATTPLDTLAKVIDTLQTQTNERTNAPSIRAVREEINNNWESIYPIGSIYMSVNNIDPSTVFGGTWEQIKDKFLLACGDTYSNGDTGGQESISYTPNGAVGDHVLTTEEMPEHTHVVTGSVTSHYIEGRVELFGDPSVTITVEQSTSGGAIAYNTISKYACDDFSIEGQATGNAGGEIHDQPHNHSFTGTQATLATMPPYLAVNMWVRTA